MIHSHIFETCMCMCTCTVYHRQRSIAEVKKKDDRKTEPRKPGVAALPLHINIIDIDEVKRFDMLKSEHIRILFITSIKKKNRFSFTISCLWRTPMQLIAAKLVTGYVTVITVRYRRVEQSCTKSNRNVPIGESYFICDQSCRRGIN